MTRPERLLVGHDFSKRADRALRRARQLCGEDGRIIVFHAAPRSQDIDAAKARLASRLRMICAPMGDERLTVEVLCDAPDAAAKRLMEAQHAELLVMGLHGKRRLLELLRGSTMARTIAALTVPTLIARTSPPKPYRKIIVGMDFAETSIAALELPGVWFPDAQVIAAHALEFNPGRRATGPMSHEEMTEARKQWLATVIAKAHRPVGCPPVQAALIPGPPVSALRKAAERFESDLVIVGRHSRGWVLDAIVGSVARGLLAAPPCDVLIVPPSATPPRSSATP